MVAAIVIPILFIVFYFIVKRNNAAYEKKWKEVGEIKEQVMISGKLERYFVEKKRFYQHRYIWHIQLFLKKDQKIIKVIFEKPAETDSVPLKFLTNDPIKCYGQWDRKTFLANRVLKNN
ncbi:hypothetical protein [Alkalihalobacterium chitinilyticum]|uniref:DUF3139 domain-containing protein n=1 Tax=Alkalihalobacterium chitinilyticum TaxID=2980103 RepID=A0ABT5VCB8_9BACI|nr:hypothetical protein [Alkalihalobacterium chitinilyticum]MDE5413094.1 hypothetical protein [Alkalihalobacterium chitinilyticum]